MQFFAPKKLVTTLGVIGLTFATTSFVSHSALATDSKPTLTIMTYDSMQDYGVTKALEKLFLPQCDCQIKWVTVPSQYQLLNQYALTAGKKSAAPVDLLLGVDLNSATQAAAKYSKLFRIGNFKVESFTNFPYAQTWNNDYAQPITSSPVTVYYNSEKYTPSRSYKDFPDLINNLDASFIFGDPRSNDLGRTLAQVIAHYGKTEQEQVVLWEKIKAKTVLVGKGWSTSYGVFAKGESQAAIAYASSEIYHVLVENKTNLKPLLKDAPVPYLVDSILLPKTSSQQALADKFAAFMLQPEAQKIVFKYNAAYPVVNIDSVLNDAEKAQAAGVKQYKVLDLRQLSAKAYDLSLKAYLQVFAK